MKYLIPRNPEVPILTQEELDLIEKVTFLEDVIDKKSDVIFVFSSTHELHWRKVLEAYNNGYAEKIIVTGGRSLTSKPHESWNHGDELESDVIVSYLLNAGVPIEAIIAERKSTNSLENVLFAMEVFDFTKISSVLLVCKSHVVGRQYRTISKYILKNINIIPYTYDAEYKGVKISRENWRNSEEGLSRVWGEYLRIVHYGYKGDIEMIDKKNILDKYFVYDNSK